MIVIDYAITGDRNQHFPVYKNNDRHHLQMLKMGTCATVPDWTLPKLTVRQQVPINDEVAFPVHISAVVSYL